MGKIVVITMVLLLAATGVRAQEPSHAHGHGQGAGQGAGNAGSPYVDLVNREIKALSAEDVASLLAGEGMGLALAAELNGYPGPRHVLELADALELTAEQRARTEEVMARMQAEARRLGAEIVAGERALDRAFATRAITPAGLQEATRSLGALRGELRAVHLAAHLAIRDLLSERQTHRYDALRGYRPGATGHGGGAHP